jgi:hypothetical protein
MDACEAATAAAVRAGNSALMTIERAESYKSQLDALIDHGFEWNETKCVLTGLTSLTGLWADPGKGVLPVVFFIENLMHDLCVAGLNHRADLSIGEIVLKIKTSYTGLKSEEIVAEALARAMAANSLGINHSELMLIKRDRDTC